MVLAKRAADGCMGWWCSGDYTRYIILAVILISVALISVVVWFWSVRRIRNGAPPLGWLAPATTRERNNETNGGHSRRGRGRRHRNHNDEEADPVPTYHAELGDGDAGYYDSDGNYIAHVPPPYHDPNLEAPSKAVVTDSTIPVDPHDENVGPELEMQMRPGTPHQVPHEVILPPPAAATHDGHDISTNGRPARS